MKIRRLLRRMLLTCLILVLALVLGAWTFTRTARFGAAPAGARLERIQQSPNYRDGAFAYPEPSPLFTPTEGESGAGGFIEYFFGKKSRLRPESPLPAQRTDLKALPPDQDLVVWLGHSSFFIQFGGQRILVDPVFSDYGAPVSFANRAFAGTSLYHVEDMPEIDILLISHDHWDHLDYDSVKALRPQVRQVVTGLGVGAHFEHWGYARDQIREGDWFDTFRLTDELTLHLLPARHYSGRRFTRNQTLWVSFALETPQRRIFLGGDSGYGPHFAEIGRRFGGFDLVVLDAGQYNKRWAFTHMFPEEAAQAAVDLQGRALLPAHIGRFSISNHAWDEPFERVTAAAAGQDYRLLTPTIGTPIKVGDSQQTFPAWWRTAQP